MKQRPGNSALNSVLITAIILVVAGSGFAAYRILNNPKTSSNNTNAAVVNQANHNATNGSTSNTNQATNRNVSVATNTAVNTSTSSNSNTATCDFAKVTVDPNEISDLPAPPSGWIRFTPNSRHFTVNMPKAPDAFDERQLMPYQNDPYLGSFFQYGNKTEKYLLYHLEEEEHCPNAVITDTSKYFDEILEKIALTLYYDRLSQNKFTYRGFPAFDFKYTSGKLSPGYPDQNQTFRYRIIIVGATIFKLEVRDGAASFSDANTDTFFNSFVPLIK